MSNIHDHSNSAWRCNNIHQRDVKESSKYEFGKKDVFHVTTAMKFKTFPYAVKTPILF